MKDAGCRASQKGQSFSLLTKYVSLDSEPVKSYLFICEPQASIFSRSLDVRLGMGVMGTFSAAAQGYGAGFPGPDAEDEFQAGPRRPKRRELITSPQLDCKSQGVIDFFFPTTDISLFNW